MVSEASKHPAAKEINPVPFIESARVQHGEEGLEIALMITEALIAHQVQSPWSLMRRVEWRDIRQLGELFNSERLDGPHGEYFDERFANFLSANFGEIGQINWRQFEGLAAEFFKREGYTVELRPRSQRYGDRQGRTASSPRSVLPRRAGE